jgi:hypothetical protein
MGDTYTRQSSYTDGDVITAAHTNNEFNQLLAAFAASTGHSHDGTAGEGGAVTKLLSNALTFGAGTAGTDITITFDGESNDGVMKWMEDEDYFEFSDDILIASTEKLQFRDTAIYINSSADGQLDIVADTEVQIAATTVDINGAVDVSGNLAVGGNLVVTGTTTFNGGTLTLGDSASDNVVFGADVDSSIIPDDDDTYDLGSSSQQWRNLYVDGTAYVDTLDLNGTAITSTAAELNIIDGGTAASSVTIVDADRLVLNDDGTMKQIAVTSLAAYLDDEITAMPNLTSVGTLGTLTVDNVIINGTTIGHTSDTDLITLASGSVTIAGDLTISGDDLTMGTNTAGHLLIADGTNFNPTPVTGLSEISTVANDDVFLAVDTSGGGLKKITRSAVVAGLATSSAISNVSEDSTPQLGGDLDVNGNDIVSVSNGNIAITPNGSGVVRLDGNVDIQSGLIDLKNSGAVSKIKFYCESSNAHAQTVQGAPHSESASNTLTLPSTGGNATLVSASSTETLTNKTLTDPVITNMTGSTITLDSAGDIILDADGANIVFKDGGTSILDIANNSTDVELTVSTADKNFLIKGTDGSSAITALDIDMALAGKATFNGDVVVGGGLTVNGTTTTVNSTTVTVDDPIFTIGGDSAPGSDDNKDRGIEFRYHNGSAAKVGFFGFDDSAGKFTFIPDATNSSEVFSGTAGTIVANLEGNVTGTLQTAAQSNITSLGTLTTLTVDNVIVNGTTIGHTDDTDLITLASGVATIAGEVSMTTLDIGGTNVTSTAAELNIMDGDTSATGTTLADADRVVTNDNGTMKQVALTDVKTYLSSAGFSQEDPTALAIALG